MVKVSDLNDANVAKALQLVEPLIERAPDIASKVIGHRPFASTKDLAQAIRTELINLPEDAKIGLFRAHPELAPDNPLTMTSESQSEQARLQLTSEQNEYRTQLVALNSAYQEAFGFPFITALVRHDSMQSVLSEFESRLKRDRASEIEEALHQVGVVSSARVENTFTHDDGSAEQHAGTRH